MEELKIIQGLCVLLVIFFIILMVMDFNNPPERYNVTEVIVGKDISHIHEAFSDSCQYHIYTNTSHFEIGLKDYNSLKVGDNVIVEQNSRYNVGSVYYMNGTMIP